MAYNLKEIDSLEVIALMDNVSDPFTKSHKNMRWNELQYQIGVRKRREICGTDLCRACLGLSLFIKIQSEGKAYHILFDTGPDDGLVVENAKRLGIDLDKLDAIILSHGHFDHCGGLLSVLKAIKNKPIPIYIHPELFAPRASTLNKDEKIINNFVLSQSEIESHGGKIIDSKDPLLLLENNIVISGEVPRKTSYEAGVPNELRFINNEWEQAPLVIDERILIFKLKKKGICVFTGCGHIGVVNACQYAQELTSIQKIHILMGGFHLAGTDFENRINPTLEDLSKINPEYIITGHCTGMKAQASLSEVFKERHIPYGVGTVFHFSA